MKHKHRLVLSIIMIVFVVILAFTIAGFNFFEFKKQVENNETLQLTQIEDKVKSSLNTLDKANVVFNQQAKDAMKSNSQLLVEKYESESDFSKWDFERLSTEIGMDIYIINDRNIVIHSSVTEDVGLDFTACCQKLIPYLTNVREEGLFSSPGIDVEQATGLVKKYSYEGTSDGKFIIELGYSVSNDKVFGSFNFLQDIESLYTKYPLIESLRVLNIGGLAIGGKQEKLTDVRREAFELTLQTKKMTEVVDILDGDEVTYRYIYYDFEESDEDEFEKIIEVAYDHKETDQTVSKNFRTLIIQLVVVIIIIALISLIIHFWVSQHVYLAQHDSLTDLKNRSMFDETLRLILEDNKAIHALMMIDLDNFKVVNDTLGHLKGDHVLKIVAETLRDTVERIDESSSVYRVGGDEFTIIMPETSEEDIVKMAKAVNKSLVQSLTTYEEFNKLNVSASIGIAVSKKDDQKNAQTLYKQADDALNQCKQQGKNNYKFYEEQ